LRSYYYLSNVRHDRFTLEVRYLLPGYHEFGDLSNYVVVSSFFDVRVRLPLSSSSSSSYDRNRRRRREAARAAAGYRALSLLRGNTDPRFFVLLFRYTFYSLFSLFVDSLPFTVVCP
jgi:hypothetical protein